MGICTGCLKNGAWCALICAILGGVLYALYGAMLPIIMYQGMAAMQMRESKAVIGRTSVEQSVSLSLDRANPSATTGELDLEFWREMIASGIYGPMVFERFPFGTTSAAPRTPLGVSSEFHIPLPENASQDSVRIVQVTWDEMQYDPKTSPTIVYFHGGGFVMGVPDMYIPFYARLSRRTGARIYAVNYLLAPEQPVPAIVSDCVSVYKHVLEELNVPADRVFLGGDSAGGGLTILAMQRIISLGLPTLPAGGFTLSPWVDLSMKNDWPSYTENAELDPSGTAKGLEAFRDRLVPADELDKTDFSDPSYSGLFGRFEGFPPMWVAVSMTEVLRDESVEMVKKIKSAGGDAVLYMPQIDLPHVWIAMAMPEGVEDTAVLANWINTVAARE